MSWTTSWSNGSGEGWLGGIHLVTEILWLRFWAQFQFSRHVIDIKRGGIFPRIPHFEEAAEPDYDSRGPRSEPNNGWSTFLGPDVDSRTMLESYPISVVDPFIRSKVRMCGNRCLSSSDLFALERHQGHQCSSIAHVSGRVRGCCRATEARH